MHLRDSTLAERKLHTVIGENARRKPRDLYDAGWVVHERPELIPNESAKKLKEWMAGLTPERKASMRQAMQKERVIRRCDVDVVWRLLENGIKDLKIERDSGRTSPGISNDGPGAAQEPKTAGGTSSNTPAQARTSAKDSVSGSPLRAALVCGVHLLRSGLLGIPEEVEHGIRRKWNIDSGGSGTANPGSGTRNPEEVEHRFRRKWNSGSGGRERSSVA